MDSAPHSPTSPPSSLPLTRGQFSLLSEGEKAHALVPPVTLTGRKPTVTELASQVQRMETSIQAMHSSIDMIKSLMIDSIATRRLTPPHSPLAQAAPPITSQIVPQSMSASKPITLGSLLKAAGSLLNFKAGHLTRKNILIWENEMRLVGRVMAGKDYHTHLQSDTSISLDENEKTINFALHTVMTRNISNRTN